MFNLCFKETGGVVLIRKMCVPIDSRDPCHSSRQEHPVCVHYQNICITKTYIFQIFNGILFIKSI